ncbi:MAG TPA: hypothetical protein VEH56_01340 [Candidatus Saccharimonadales bacterium]|nr:hypothetical protein [Candidatus Saccharimonadales bacterium]
MQTRCIQVLMLVISFVLLVVPLQNPILTLDHISLGNGWLDGHLWLIGSIIVFAMMFRLRGK